MPYMRLSARCKRLKLPEAQITALTSLKTHETLHRQALSLPLSLIGPLASELRHLSFIKLPDGQKLPHFIHLRSEPFPHLSLHVTNEIDTSLHSEACVHILHACLPTVVLSMGKNRRSEQKCLCWRLREQTRIQC